MTGTRRDTQRGRQWRGRLVGAVCVLAAGLVAFAITLRFLPGPGERPSWTSGSGQPAPDQWFRILMFPVSASVALYDAPEGKEVGTLTRAVANAPSEMNADKWIHVNKEGSAGLWVRAQDLSPLPVVQDGQTHIDALANSLKLRTGDQFAGVQFSQSQAPGGIRVTVRMSGEGGWQISTYLVQGRAVQPEKLVLVSEGWGLLYAVNVLVAAGIAMLAGTAVHLGIWWYRARGRQTERDDEDQRR